MDAAAPVRVHCEIAAKLNFACHQSAFAFLRDLRVENLLPDARLEGLTVTLAANPGFLKPKAWRIDRIEPGGVVAVRDRDVSLDGQFLLELVDAVRGDVTVTVEQDGRRLGELVQPVELLAYNEWGGAGYMPELLAAFCVPNDPAVERVLREASLVLRRAGTDANINGYESGSRQRVWEIASAIYSAVCNLQLSYALPPASFESNGQKIRLPGQILDNRMATCLDSALLFASAFEQAGLNPVIAMPSGHAMAGVWLQPEDFSAIVVDEAEALRKRVQLQELLLFETTFVTQHPAPPLSKAVAKANELIHPDLDAGFHCAVDIRRARSHRIQPLGLKQGGSAAGGPDEGVSIESGLEAAPPLPDFDLGAAAEQAPETPSGRLDRWQRKLLDLSARNPLLNHRAGKTSLALVCPEPALLEDRLAAGTAFSIAAMPGLGQDDDIHRQRTGEVINIEYAREALDRKQLLVALPQDELDKRAVNIYRQARTALQEGGANTLYLAVGYLLWKREEKDERRYRAPLILLPVTLKRESVRSGVKVLAHDDEPRFNTTLLEMLRKDFGIEINGLDGSLPTDESGVNVPLIWNMVRQAVKNSPGFEVVEDVMLGHFSFAKYLMWKDLVDRTEALRQSPVVQHLLDTPREPYLSDTAFVEPREVDRGFAPSDLLTPLPADASQLAAVATADRGKDFIIIGPPGTGKSQTISNLIAHTLGKGRTVLFVSEKTAALEVVYRRLADIGLGRFCLQLHSNKASKADVLAQLGEAWSFRQAESASAWEKEAERLKALRDQLNSLVDSLHKRRRNGLTAHHALGVKIRDEALAAGVVFDWPPRADAHDEAQLEAMREAVANLAVQAAAIGEVTGSPFRDISHADWSPQWQAQMVERAGALASAAGNAGQAAARLQEALGITVPDNTLARMEALADLAAVLLDSWRQPTAYALEPDGQDRIEALEEAVRRLKGYAQLQAGLSCSYAATAWQSLDGAALEARWTEAVESWWLKRFFARRAIIRDMRAGGAQGRPDPARDAPLLQQLRAEGEAITRLESRLAAFREWQAHATDPAALEPLRRLGERLRSAINRLADDAEGLTDLRGRMRRLLQDGNDLLAHDAAVGRAAMAFRQALAAVGDACGQFEAVAGSGVRERFAAEGRSLPMIRETAEAITSRHRELNNWCAWRRRRAEALDLGLAALVNAVEAGGVPADALQETFEAAYCAWWSAALIGEDDVLRGFSSAEHESAIARFRAADDEYRKLTAAWIAARLAGRLPEEDDVSRGSSWGLLRRELQKKSRHKPVRQLVQEAPDVISALAPCLMMSPLSVAQYLPPEQALFDVVIFDEASQITVWDAVGALARGRQAIIAGDPKQMPPTNFFARADDDPDGDVDAEGDLESILDEMLGASIPQRVLNLHYRSRRESLIAFSNYHYYDNSLVTFPAPVHPDEGVRLVRPNGTYSRGKARHNQGEAKAIVAEIVRRLTHADEAVRHQSLGVVTFNTEQQTLIENLLDEARRSNPGLEWAFAAEDADGGGHEPVFVKNLETVQGDERDVILFSVTYGPDESGHVTMNFGPLNRTGGERRLNVAMTRARSEMLVFSTLSPDRIDLARTSARAVADLKHFLEYAERGPAVLGAAVHGSLGDFESPFETAVARALRDRGWEVRPQIGVSAFRIDLGIAHPGFPGRYLAGVECDGAMYHSSAVARERDKVRQEVLEGLGWTLFRVWSTDWWTNRAGALDKLHDALSAHLAAERARTAAAGTDDGAATAGKATAAVAEPMELVATAAKRSAPASGDTVRPGPLRDAHVDAPLPLTAAGDSAPMDTPPGAAATPGPTAIARPAAHAAGSEGRAADRYVMADLTGDAFAADPALFPTDGYRPRLAAMLDHVIDTEGPIHEEVLLRRIARHHGFRRTGDQIRQTILATLARRRPASTESSGRFYWPKGTTNNSRPPARIEGREDDLAEVDHICRPELRAIRERLGTGDDPVELARALGIGRVTDRIRERLESALAPRA